MINDQQLVGEDGKLNPSPAVAAINRVLQQPKTGLVSINWDMVARSLLGLYSVVGEGATSVDKTSGIDFTVVVED